MQLQFTDEELAFRDEVRAFLRDALPTHIREQTVRAPSYVSSDDTREWHHIVHDKGWVAPNWPVEFGGTGWTATQKYIYDEEYQAAQAPRLSPFGLGMVGPVIYTFGTEAQKQRYLGPILSGEELWCQGYSEPGSGSDLASLQTRAVRDGEDYVVNGQKIWTSHAHHADMMFCLVRTDTEVKQQAGITFLLIDMKTPGIEVKPIISIDGGHYLNEVFFADVRVPVANRIGEENKGWDYAKFLLGHERNGIAGVGKSKTKVARLKELARLEHNDGGKLADDATFRRKLATLETELTALEHTQLGMLSREAAGHGLGAETSMLKISGTEIEQGLNELMVEAMAYYGLPYELEMLRADANVDPVVPEHGLGLMTEHLLRRAASIYGGTNEIQRNILAKRVLGL
ncbi:MAG: acyl-CoA dehydrogenase family protein [Alphaproteobacteria bacterium]